MKLEAVHRDTTYRIEVTPSGSDGDRFSVTLEDARHEVRILDRSQGRWTLEIDGRIEDVVVSETGEQRVVEWASRTFAIEVYSLKDRFRHGAAEAESDGVAALRAQMPGKVIQVMVAPGETVEKGQGLVVIEAMKMQNELRSPRAGSVLTCKVSEGTSVNAGDLLFEVG